MSTKIVDPDVRMVARDGTADPMIALQAHDISLVASHLTGTNLDSRPIQDDDSRAGINAANAPGMFGAKYQKGEQPPAIPAVGPITALMTAPGGDALPNPPTSSPIIDKLMNTVYTAGNTKTSRTGNERIYQLFKIERQCYGAVRDNEALIERCIGRQTIVWGLLPKQSFLTEDARDAMGWRGLNVKFRHADELYQKAVKDNNKLEISRRLKPGSMEAVDRFKKKIRRLGVLSELRNHHNGDVRTLVGEFIQRGMAQVVGVWGDEERDAKTGDRVGMRYVVRTPGREIEEVKAQNEGRLWELRYTPEEIAMRYSRVEPVILGENGLLKLHMYNGPDWKGHFEGIGTLSNVKMGYTYKSIHSALPTYLYSSDQSAVYSVIPGMPIVELLVGVF